jgi:ABC-type branched-subunit amino acid transport system substrate-binding protein
VAVLAAGCTSRGRDVNVPALLRADGGSATSGEALPSSTDSSTVGGGSAAGGSGSSGGSLAGGSSGSVGGLGGTGSSGTGGSASGGGTAASPATGGTVKIGLHISANLQAAYAAFGAKNAGGDITPQLLAVVDWINAHGGMHGRKVEPIIHSSDPLNGTFDSEAQAACSDFADDKHVFAVVSGAVLPTPVTPDCLSKKHVPIVWNYHFLVDGQMWAQWMPYLYMPFSVNADRMGFYIDQLAANGYFDAGARVGIVRYDVPEHARLVNNVLRPRLAAHKVNVVDEAAISRPPSAASAADTANQVGATILRFRSENISHVLFVPTGGAVPFIFMSEAEGQSFRPRYAMNSLDIPYFVGDQTNSNQLHGALAIGWSPASDTHHEQDPTPVTPNRALCYSITKTNDAARYCDGLFFLKAALDRATEFDAAGLRAAVEGMGSAFDPVFSLQDKFGPGLHDGASAVRLVAYDDGCSCFAYKGPLVPIE